MASFLIIFFVTYIRVNIYLIQFNKLYLEGWSYMEVEVGQIVNTMVLKGSKGEIQL